MTDLQTKQRPGKTTQKWPSGPMQVRIKFLPPTVEEAVLAARDLADDIEGQVEIAAGLMGVGPEMVRDEVERVFAQTREAEDKIKAGSQVMVRDRAGGSRAVVVQRTGRASRAVVVERNRFAGNPVTGSRPGTIRTFDLTRRPGS